MLNVFALIVMLIGSFILTALALPLLLQLAVGRFWPQPKKLNEFVVRGTHREHHSTMQARRRALGW
jgi:hypothetical protein